MRFGLNTLRAVECRHQVRKAINDVRSAHRHKLGETITVLRCGTLLLWLGTYYMATRGRRMPEHLK